MILVSNKIIRLINLYVYLSVPPGTPLALLSAGTSNFLFSKREEKNDEHALCSLVCPVQYEG